MEIQGVAHLLPSAVRGITRPWSRGAGTALAAAGASLAGVAAANTGRNLLPWCALAILALGAVEVGVGISRARDRGEGVAEAMAGATPLAFAGIVFSLQALTDDAFEPGTFAMILGIFSVCSGLTRGLNVLVTRSKTPVRAVVEGALTLALGIVLVTRWRTATVDFTTGATGASLLIAGLGVALRSEGPWRTTGAERAPRLAHVRTS